MGAFHLWRVFQALLIGVEDPSRFITFPAELKRCPRHGDFRPADSQKTAHVEDNESNLAGRGLDQNFLDIADILILQIVDFSSFDFRDSDQRWINSTLLLRCLCCLPAKAAKPNRQYGSNYC